MEAERIIERTKANYFEDGNISLESPYDYNIESYSEELSNKYKLKLIDGDINYEIIFYLPKDKSIYSNWTFVGSFFGPFTLGVFINFTNLSSNSLKFYREKSENEIDYARDFLKREIEFSDKVFDIDKAVFPNLENTFGFYLYSENNESSYKHNYSYYSFSGGKLKRYAMNLPYYTDNPKFTGGGYNILAEELDDAEVNFNKELSLLEILLKNSNEVRRISVYLEASKYEK